MQLDLTARNPEVFLFTNLQGTGSNNPLALIDPMGLLEGCPNGVSNGQCNPPPALPSIPWWDCRSFLSLCFSLPTSVPTGPFVVTINPPIQPTKVELKTENLCAKNQVDPFLGSLELSLKLGPEGEAGPLKAGFTFNKNLSTGETSGTVDVNAALVSLTIESKTPRGGTLGGDSADTSVVISFFGGQFNLGTGEWSFDPSKSIHFGLQGIAGAELSLNSAKYKQLSRERKACQGQ